MASGTCFDYITVVDKSPITNGMMCSTPPPSLPPPSPSSTHDPGPTRLSIKLDDRMHDSDPHSTAESDTVSNSTPFTQSANSHTITNNATSKHT